MNIIVLISGSGSNLQALIDAEHSKKLNGTITDVISSQADAYGLKRAEKASIPSQVHSLKEYYKGTPKEEKDKRQQLRKKFDKDLADIIIAKKPDLVVCAGWMLILSPAILDPLKAAGITIINLHPALPNAFDGTHAIERAWKAGQAGEITKAGVMIHYVIADVDKGEPIVIKELDLRKDESLDDYEDRVHKLEHVAIVEGTNKVLDKIAKDKATDDDLAKAAERIKI
ncbi:hypothetical protein DIURU_003524 [Diutina rugosa]|uniref:Phosphoribosylglycinamide formyltransferase n=1 Tax=Diutina rugosa TaxID=5481 RepID=A0A642USW9_DIURU|nr:uncharacterized protein DIURU_003524 [Diutina rugosa]KAA8901154.1 hypothetical protein DIURU_003524 [Diutina rugosa]